MSANSLGANFFRTLVFVGSFSLVVMPVPETLRRSLVTSELQDGSTPLS